jgi:hypothetical protein
MLRSWQSATWIVAAVMAAAVSYGIVRIPLQPTDSLIPLLKAQTTLSVAAATIGSFRNAGYLRPFRIGQIQILYEAARGRHYFAVFKGFHVVLALAAFALFVFVLRVRTRADFFAATFALTVFTGIHTFVGTVWEAYPINHFLEIGVFCLGALALAQSRGGWWSDLGACLLLLVAALTLESGLLVWVVAVVAWLTGLRGISRRAVVVMTLLVAGYFVLRFGVLDTGAPSLAERSSTFGTERLKPEELIAKFGSRPHVFYAYNVVSSGLSVLASEPRAGRWTIAQELRDRHTLFEGTALNVVTSLATTALIVVYATRRWRDWRRRRFEWPDQIVLVTVAVIGANALISFGYTKDEIMSVAGIFYALAAYVAARDLVHWVPFRSRRLRAVLALVILVVALGWALRSAGLHYHMRRMAFRVRNDWVDVEQWLEVQHASPSTPAGTRLVTYLREDALNRSVTNPFFFPQWVPRWIR